MNILWFVLSFLGIGVVGGIIFGFGILYRMRTAPMPPQPEPKKFGLNEAEAVKEQLGGLDESQAQAAQVAAMVGGMNYTVSADIAVEQRKLEGAKAQEEEAIARMKEVIARSILTIRSVKERGVEVESIAKAFGI